jgi:phenylalanyl-tRNA synthetase beta chain
MPTIDIQITELESLLRQPIDRVSLEILLARVKGEVKAFSAEENAARLELNDSNRPDLWSLEGIVRQIRPCQTPPDYPFFKEPAAHHVTVSKEIASVRPYLAACAARGVVVTESLLAQLIQVQEKLADIFGQKRKAVSIGLYRLEKIVFPVSYSIATPDVAFVPLGCDQPMTMAEILAHHPKGIAYAHTLKGHYPILMDAEGQILSFPPIINSRALGEVQVGDSDLFVEVTGTNLRRVVLALNIFACNLFDRGATIAPVEVHYPWETELGMRVKAPFDLGVEVEVPLPDFERVLGERVTADEAMLWLSRYGHTVRATEGALRVTAPPYRDDIMHPIDLIEDFAISRGYATFVPRMPSEFSVGSLTPIESLSDRLREAMVGLGFQEVVSNLLGSKEEMLHRTGAQDEQEKGLVEIQNPMTERFACLRPWILPSLLRVESVSSRASYPHQIFEVGEVAHMNPLTAEAETVVHLAGLVAHPAANFSALQAVLETALAAIGWKCRLSPHSHPTFIRGRSGAIEISPRNGAEIAGIIGEVHPEVLTRWQIGMPTAAFEIAISKSAEWLQRIGPVH